MSPDLLAQQGLSWSKLPGNRHPLSKQASWKQASSLETGILEQALGNWHPLLETGILPLLEIILQLLSEEVVM